MSLRGTPTGPSGRDKDKKKGKTKDSGSAPGSFGSSYTPPSRGSGGPPSSYTPYSGTPSSSGSKPGLGGFKLPGTGGGAGGGEGGVTGLGNTIWGPDATGPGFTSTWSEGTKLMVAVGSVLACVVALGLLTFGLLKGKGNSNPQSQQTFVTNITKFVPQTTTNGGNADMPITFTDGTSADLVYNPDLDLANLGVSLFDSGTLGQFQRANLQFQIDHGGASYVTVPTGTPAPQGLSAPGGSNVPVLPAASDTPGNFLDFKFGDWHVGIWEGTDQDQMSAADDASWAQNLTGQQSASGFLVLTAKAPLKLTPFGAAGGGPYMVFGDINTTGIILTPEACTAPVGKNVVNNNAGVPVRIAQNLGAHYEGYMCLPGNKMDVQVFGTNQFVSDATNSIAISNLKPGPARPQ